MAPYNIITLLSDGIDSPVASYLMMKKGFIPIFLTFITTKSQERQMKKKIRSIVKKLKKFSKNKLKIYFIPFTNTLEHLIEKCPRKLTCILCKRLMYRISIRIGVKEQTNLILTGDILGEQASQTLSNLDSFHSIFKDHIKISPLIGMNKLDVININKEIGLFQVCSQKLHSCQYYPQYPETNSKITEIIHAETLINLDILILNAINKAKIEEI
ncbi:MAG: hypothetical protein EU547_00880 [Promethearchaeota archaeon]|nr:MAG: hypothetical protein EU547_00880 [Candidatus Lokiarchaeota archaeon]